MRTGDEGAPGPRGTGNSGAIRVGRGSSQPQARGSGATVHRVRTEPLSAPSRGTAFPRRLLPADSYRIGLQFRLPAAGPGLRAARVQPLLPTGTCPGGFGVYPRGSVSVG